MAEGLPSRSGRHRAFKVGVVDLFGGRSSPRDNRVQVQERSKVDRALLVAMLVMVSLWPVARASTTAELDDAAARVQYAFYTDDVQALQELQSVLTSLATPPQWAAMKEYYLGFAQWKTAQLYERRAREQPPGAEDRAQVVKAAQACSTHMQAVIARDARFAEAHAIGALCDGIPQSLRGPAGRPASNPCGRSKGLQAALALEPNNPRILLVGFLCGGPALDEGPAVRLEQLRKVVAAFEAEPPSRPGKPDWGEAEALVFLGEHSLRQGDSLAARDALERALVLAPDFHVAQEMLQAAAARPR